MAATRESIRLAARLDARHVRVSVLQVAFQMVRACTHACMRSRIFTSSLLHPAGSTENPCGPRSLNGSLTSQSAW